MTRGVSQALMKLPGKKENRRRMHALGKREMDQLDVVSLNPPRCNDDSGLLIQTVYGGACHE